MLLKTIRRYKKDQLHNYHAGRFSLSNHHSNVNTRQSHDSHVPLSRLKVGKQCLTYKVGEIWNSLPFSFKTYDKTLFSFIRKLKFYPMFSYKAPCSETNGFSCIHS